MKASGHGSYVIAYSASIYALSEVTIVGGGVGTHCEIERSENISSSGVDKSMTTALEKGLA